MEENDFTKYRHANTSKQNPETRKDTYVDRKSDTLRDSAKHNKNSLWEDMTLFKTDIKMSDSREKVEITALLNCTADLADSVAIWISQFHRVIVRSDKQYSIVITVLATNICVCVCVLSLIHI